MNRRRPFLLVLAAVLTLAGLLAVYRQPLWDRLDLETKHRVVAAYSRVTARRVETANSVVVSPQVPNRIGANVFLDQEVSIDDRHRSLTMLRAAGIGWIRQHTEFGAQAHRWAQAKAPNGLLLRSPVLEEAERWIASRPRGAMRRAQTPVNRTPDARVKMAARPRVQWRISGGAR